MSYLLANGCSYTDENFGGNSGNFIHTNQEKDKLGIPRSNWKMWPEYVAEKMNIPHLNLGSSGASNSRMYTTSSVQIQRQKPKILMHLWTSGSRFNYYNHKYHNSNYTSAVFYASELMNHNGYLFSEEGAKSGFTRRMVEFSFQAIQLFYPERLEETFKFYTSFHSDDDSILELLSDCKKNIVDINTLPNNGGSHLYLQASLMKTWIQYMNFCSYFDRDTCYQNADKIISMELEPILQTYYMAKAENIPFVSMFTLELTPYQVNLNISKKLKSYRHVIKDITKNDRKSTSKNNSARRFIHLIDKDNLNKFEIIILFNHYLHQTAKDNLINNPTFMKLDDLISEKKIIAKCWPPFGLYGLSREEIEKSITKNWKPLSNMDIHPHPDTQKHIGDAFYDLYQENYS